MRLKWPPVRLRRRRAGPGSSRLLPRGGPGARRAALHFCGRPANGSRSRPMRSLGGGGSASARRAYSPASRRSGKGD